MDFNPDRPHTHYYRSIPQQFHHVPAMITTSYPYPHLPYPPYTQFVYRNQPVIVNVNDFNNFQQLQQLSVYRDYHPYIHEVADEVMILDSFDHDNNNYSYNYNGGLTKKVINKKLKISSYCDDGEEGEVCVICQVEFETEERLGVLDCGHRYHPACIKEWLMRKNICPVCKAQALVV